MEPACSCPAQQMSRLDSKHNHECGHAELSSGIRPPTAGDAISVGNGETTSFGSRSKHGGDAEEEQVPVLEGRRRRPSAFTGNDDVDLTEQHHTLSRAESATLFPPLTKTPPLLHSYRDLSVSSLFSGVLCCLFNIALYLISGGISRLLQQERELQRHQSLQYVCPAPSTDRSTPSRASAIPVGVKHENAAAPCTSEEGLASRTRVVVFNIPYFMSWFSQSLQACFLFFAVSAIKRRRARMARLGLTSDTRQAPGVLSPVHHRAGEVAGVECSGEVDSSSFSNTECDGSSVVAALRQSREERVQTSQGLPASPINEKKKRTRPGSATSRARLNDHVSETAPGRQFAGEPRGKVSAAAVLDTEAEDRSEPASQATRVMPAASCASGASEYISDSICMGAQQKDSNHALASAEKPTMTTIPTAGLGITVREEESARTSWTEVAARRQYPDCLGKPVSRVANVGGLVTDEAHGNSDLLVDKTHGQSPTEKGEGVSHPSERAERADAIQTTDAGVNLPVDNTGPQTRCFDLDRECRSSRAMLLVHRGGRLVMEGIVLCKREVVDRLWVAAVQAPLSKLVVEPFRRHIYVPFLAGTHDLIREFVEVEVQYASLDQLVCACLWIGALYLLQSWTWTVAVGKDGMSVGTVTAIYNTNPVFVFLFTVCLYKEGADDCVQIIALILATVGVAIIAYHNEGEPTSTSGVALSVCCAAFSGLFEVVYKNYILNGKSNLPLAFIFLIVGIIGVLSLLFFWVPIAALHFFGFEVFPESPPPPLLVFLLLFVCVCTCLHTLILQVSLLLLPSPILVALCSLLSLPAAAAADWLSGGGGGVGGIGSFFIASAFLLTAVNEWRIREMERESTYKRLHSFAERHPDGFNVLRAVNEEHRKQRLSTRVRTPLIASAGLTDPERQRTSLESLTAGLLAHKQDADVGEELKEVLCICKPVQDETELRVPPSPPEITYYAAVEGAPHQQHDRPDVGDWERVQAFVPVDAGSEGARDVAGQYAL